MSRIPETVLREVLGRADIVQVISEYTRLKRVSGNNYTGLCPIHQEKTPSFHVTPSKSLFYCFGCGKGGTVIDFLRAIEGLSFPEAVRWLGERFGVEVPRYGDKGGDDEAYQQQRKAQDQLLQAMQRALAFFCHQLDAAAGVRAREYLKVRGLSAEIIKAFRLGFAPDQWDGLQKHLDRFGFDAESVELAGLTARREGGGSYDRFRNRVTFPIFDPFDRPVGFSARALDPDAPAKYINSPETPIYTKGKLLYGLHRARDPMRRDGTALLVEGNFDVVCMHQAGFVNTVAPLGTALTPDQAKLLSRHTDRVILLFDADAAGQRAAHRALTPLRDANIDPHIAILPSGEDPDSFLKLYGTEGMKELLDTAQPLLTWTLDQLISQILQRPIDQRAAALDPLGQVLSRLSPAMVQRHYIQESSRRLGMSPLELMDATHIKIEDEVAVARRAGVKFVDASTVEFELLQILLRRPSHIPDLIDAQYIHLFAEPRIISLLNALAPHLRNPPPDAAPDAADSPDEPATGIQRLLWLLDSDSPERHLAIKALASPIDWRDDRLDDAFRGALARLMKLWIDRQTSEIAHQIEAAIANSQLSEVNRLLEHKVRLERLLPELQAGRKIDWSTLQRAAPS
jgi:DNA primase